MTEPEPRKPHECAGCRGRAYADSSCAECRSREDVSMVPEVGKHLCRRHRRAALDDADDRERDALGASHDGYRRWRARGAP